MCSRTAFTKPILPRNEMKTATPPNGVTARCVSRRINRSSDNRAVISRGTGLSVAFDSIFLLSQILGPNLTPNFGFPVKSYTNGAADEGMNLNSSVTYDVEIFDDGMLSYLMKLNGQPVGGLPPTKVAATCVNNDLLTAISGGEVVTVGVARKPAEVIPT